jgi:hypothetical protein
MRLAPTDQVPQRTTKRRVRIGTVDDVTPEHPIKGRGWHAQQVLMDTPPQEGRFYPSACVRDAGAKQRCIRPNVGVQQRKQRFIAV